ncbi:MAG: hypothetical protein HYU36_07805 [Planctomycetes bacterium]|nr:hypothetical protein [Planctomycetota bacterium]
MTSKKTKWEDQTKKKRVYAGLPGPEDSDRVGRFALCRAAAPGRFPREAHRRIGPRQRGFRAPA